MPSASIQVAFRGPFSLEPQNGFPTVIGGDVGREASGVYLWTVEHQGGYLINYVGETRAGFGRRTQAQVQWLRNNRDYIWDVKRLL
jgi:hypothetical protein